MTIARHVLAEVLAHAREAMPRECCGMLIGTPPAIECSMRAANIAAGTRRFRIEPRDHLAAIKLARQTRLDVVGFYHSHPHTRAYPSDTDVAESAYAHAVHLIVGFPEGEVETRLFRLEPEGIVEEPLLVVDGRTAS
ncbi:MAG: Mov34/MPN/PAD-1 family protein [Vicinamibacterales bacterium]